MSASQSNSPIHLGECRTWDRFLSQGPLSYGPLGWIISCAPLGVLACGAHLLVNTGARQRFSLNGNIYNKNIESKLTNSPILVFTLSCMNMCCVAWKRKLDKCFLETYDGQILQKWGTQRVVSYLILHFLV